MNGIPKLNGNLVQTVAYKETKGTTNSEDIQFHTGLGYMKKEHKNRYIFY